MHPAAELSPRSGRRLAGRLRAALADRDIEGVVRKFATDNFWRDLVAFTWNIKTVEVATALPPC